MSITCQQAIHIDNPNASSLVDVPEITVDVVKLVEKGIELITRTCRRNGKYQASVCVICDRLIIGTE